MVGNLGGKVTATKPGRISDINLVISIVVRASAIQNQFYSKWFHAPLTAKTAARKSAYRRFVSVLLLFDVDKALMANVEIHFRFKIGLEFGFIAPNEMR
jgi:hypothetical protein